MSNYDPGPTIAHAGGINIGTPDLDRSLWFFRDILGMEVTAEADGVAYLRGYHEMDHHSLVLTQQKEAMINTYSLRVSRPEDVGLFHDQLKAEGIEVRRLSAGSEIGRGEAIRFLTPASQHPFELYYDIEKPKAPADLQSKLLGSSSRRRGLGVQRIDHLNLATSMDTLVAAEEWMRKSLGLKRREAIVTPDESEALLSSWMSTNSKMHDVAIGASPNNKIAQFHHVAFNLESFHDTLVAADHLKELDVQIDAGPGRHGAGQAMYLYVRDPGSNLRIELYSGGRQYFEPDWEALIWKMDNPNLMTWIGDLPDVNMETSSFVPTMPSAGLDR